MSEDVSGSLPAGAAASGSPDNPALLDGKTVFTAADTRLIDDGNGGLMTDRGVKVSGGRIDYASGRVSIPKAPFADKIHLDSYAEFALAEGAPPTVTTVGDLKIITDIEVVAPARAMASWVSAPETRTLSEDGGGGEWVFELLAEVPYPRAALLDSWRFDVGGETVIERNGVLYKNWNALTGTGEAVGTLDPLGGRAAITLSAGEIPAVRILSGVYVAGDYQVKQYYGRTAAAPIKPRSLTVYADVGKQTLIGNSQADGSISGQLSGKVDYETGFYELSAAEPLPPDAVRFNAVSQSHLPIAAAHLGINPTRLPADGRVPVFRAGDYVVISNKLKQGIGSAHTAGQTVKLQRQDCDRICVTDSTGKHVAADKYTEDLDAGTLTWATPLDLSDYTLPLVAVQIWEEDGMVASVDISGNLRLQNPLKRDYPQEHTYISSAVVGGDLQVRATEPFAMTVWNKLYQDIPDSDPIRARLNVKDYPIVLTADGAIDGRWLIEFTAPNQFDLYEERLGLVLQGNTYTDVAPLNPATGKPYFTLPHQAFGAGGWETGNCIRFNTTGTVLPVWVVRVVQQSQEKQQGSDGFVVCLRGNTEILPSAAA